MGLARPLIIRNITSATNINTPVLMSIVVTIAKSSIWWEWAAMDIVALRVSTS